MSLRIVITDITERKQKEFEMQKFVDIINSTDDGDHRQDAAWHYACQHY